MLSQYRRDFRAIFECEHCESEIERPGYDDAHFHSHVIPNLKCDMCGEKAKKEFRGLTPKHPEGMQV